MPQIFFRKKAKSSVARSRKIAAAGKAAARARATVRKISGRPRAPPRTGGFWGVGMRDPDEVKFIDSVSGVGSVGPTGGVALINGIIQGDDYNQREGRKVTWTSLLFRGTIFSNNSSDVGDVIRVMVVWDNQSNGALPAVGDVLQTVDYHSPMNLNNRDRFMVLCDNYYTAEALAVSGGALTAGAPCPNFFNIYKKFNLSTIFSATTANIGAISTGSMFVLAISLATNVSQLSYTARLRFIDP